jgi:hypothetical protein
VRVQCCQPQVPLELQEAKTAALKTLLQQLNALLLPKPWHTNHATWRRRKQQCNVLQD